MARAHEISKELEQTAAATFEAITSGESLGLLYFCSQQVCDPAEVKTEVYDQVPVDEIPSCDHGAMVPSVLA